MKTNSFDRALLALEKNNITEGAMKAIQICRASDELLDLLKRAVARVEDANQRGDMILNAWQKEARAAIAKAEGREGE